MVITIKQKKELAKIIYTRNNFTQKEVAARVGVSANVLGRWIKAENWEELKTSITITREEQLMRMYNQVAELNHAIANRDKGARYASSKEADILNKLAAAIDKMERDVGLSDILEVSKRFLDWMRPVDIEKAKELSNWFDAFIKDNLRS
jgi:uncharacterized protein YjcR